MCVNAKVMVLNNNGSISKINCYNDGFLAGIGVMLNERYQNNSQVRKLISSGDISKVDITHKGKESLNYDDTRHQTKTVGCFNSLSDIHPSECNYLYVPSRARGDKWLYCVSDVNKYEDDREMFNMYKGHSKFSYEYLKLLVAKMKMNHRNCLKHRSSWKSVKDIFAPLNK